VGFRHRVLALLDPSQHPGRALLLVGSLRDRANVEEGLARLATTRV
jgi:hypothetical protein